MRMFSATDRGTSLTFSTIRIQTYILGAPTVIRRGNRTNTIPRADRRQLQPIRQQGIIVPQPNAAYTRCALQDIFICPDH